MKITSISEEISCYSSWIKHYHFPKCGILCMVMQHRCLWNMYRPEFQQDYGTFKGVNDLSVRATFKGGQCERAPTGMIKNTLRPNEISQTENKYSMISLICRT